MQQPVLQRRVPQATGPARKSGASLPTGPMGVPWEDAPWCVAVSEPSNPGMGKPAPMLQSGSAATVKVGPPVTDDALIEELRTALEALIAEARAAGPGRVLTAAERNAALWVSDREEAPASARRDLPVPETARTLQ